MLEGVDHAEAAKRIYDETLFALRQKPLLPHFPEPAPYSRHVTADLYLESHTAELAQYPDGVRDLFRQHCQRAC